MEWYLVESTISLTTEFASLYSYFTYVEVMENTSFVLLGGRERAVYNIPITTQTFYRLDRNDVTTYYRGVLNVAADNVSFISSLHLIKSTRWVVMAENNSRRVSIGDITTMGHVDQALLLNQQSIPKFKFIKGVNHFVNDTIFAIATDRVQLFKVDKLVELAQSPAINFEAVIGLEAWDQSPDLAVLTDKKLYIYRVSKTGEIFSVALVVSNNFPAQGLRGITFNQLTNDIMVIKNDGVYQQAFLPGLTCHPNCQNCARSFSAGRDACPTCAVDSTFSETLGICAKNATPNPFGGFYQSYVGIGGEKMNVSKFEDKAVTVDEVDPAKNYEPSDTVMTIMLGTIVLITLVVLFGLVSLTRSIFG